jgi:hypothetical protein
MKEEQAWSFFLNNHVSPGTHEASASGDMCESWSQDCFQGKLAEIMDVS